MTLKRLIGTDLDQLLAVPPGLFDNPVDPVQARAFLASPLHHLFVGYEGDLAVSFASGSVLLHPDKDPALFINEVGTRDGHLRQGWASAVTRALIAHGRAIGCDGIWLGTEPDNIAARGFYQRLEAEERCFIGYAWDGAFDLD